MARKTDKKVEKRKKTPTPVPEPETKALPQNIVPMGERVLESKNIYISQPTYKAIHNFTKDKTTNESGGILVGYTIEEFGKTNIVIDGFIEAKYTEATPTTITFTHQTWDSWHKELAKKHADKKIVGWIHTHPNFGIFLSEYDKFIQDNFFNADSQVAYVVDPIQEEEGFYFWIDKKLEKCNGFYIFDKTGKKISAREDNEKQDQPSQPSEKLGMKDVVLLLLLVAILLMSLSILRVNSKATKVEREFQAVFRTMNQVLVEEATQIQALEGRIETLERGNEAVKPDQSVTTPTPSAVPSEASSAVSNATPSATTQAVATASPTQSNKTGGA